MKDAIQLVEYIAGALAFVAAVADESPHHAPVLLLDVTVVVLAVGTGAGKGNLLVRAIPVEVMVDERSIRYGRR
jgi:hypothetical protein